MDLDDGDRRDAFPTVDLQELPAVPGLAAQAGATFAPALSAAGAEALQVLDGMRAGRSIGQIAEQLLAAHPGRFRSLDHAHGFVAELAQRYGE